MIWFPTAVRKLYFYPAGQNVDCVPTIRRIPSVIENSSFCEQLPSVWEMGHPKAKYGR